MGSSSRSNIRALAAPAVFETLQAGVEPSDGVHERAGLAGALRGPRGSVSTLVVDQGVPARIAHPDSYDSPDEEVVVTAEQEGLSRLFASPERSSGPPPRDRIAGSPLERSGEAKSLDTPSCSAARMLAA